MEQLQPIYWAINKASSFQWGLQQESACGRSRLGGNQPCCLSHVTWQTLGICDGIRQHNTWSLGKPQQKNHNIDTLSSAARPCYWQQTSPYHLRKTWVLSSPGSKETSDHMTSTMFTSLTPSEHVVRAGHHDLNSVRPIKSQGQDCSPAAIHCKMKIGSVMISYKQG